MTPRTARRTLALALVLTAALAQAANDPKTGLPIPRQIPYRGVLEQNGAPVDGVTLPMTFSLYDAATGGTALWSEQHDRVNVQRGRFGVALGDVTPIPASAFAQADLYLEVSVAGSPLVGRQRLYSVPYAQHAAVSSATPAGSLMAFAGPAERAPMGWLPCDGRLLEAAAFPALFAAIGYSYGGSGASFALPDLRGRFLRGADAGTGRDPGPRGAGQVQDWSTGMARQPFGATHVALSHGHQYGDFYAGGGGCGPQLVRPLSMLEGSAISGRCEEQRSTSTSAEASHGHAIAGGDAETRPANVTATWIIRSVD